MPVGYLIGDEENGFKYMAEALNVSRLGTGMSGIAFARRAFLEAAIYTNQREAFGQNISQVSNGKRIVGQYDYRS